MANPFFATLFQTHFLEQYPEKVNILVIGESMSAGGMK